MARAKLERTVLTSFLDRLIDRDRGSSSDRALTFDESVRRFKSSVLRDLEWLLNTRRGSHSPDAMGEEVRRSIYNYGLPDVGSMSAASADSHAQLLRNIEESIGWFEPRLHTVRASLVESTDAVTIGELHLRIDAQLEMDPSPERVSFDTVIDVSTGRFTLGEPDDA